VNVRVNVESPTMRIPGDLPLVPWQDGLMLPARFRATVEDDKLPYRIELEIKVVDRHPTCTKLTLAQRGDGPPVSSRELRSARLTAYLAIAATQAAWRVVPLGTGSVAVEQPAIGEEIVVQRVEIEPPRQGRHRLSDDHLREVARLYRDALAEGKRAPREAIKAQIPASTATIARWVQEARRKGFLGEATPRRAGEAPKEQETGEML
jgi:hypothetical protein